MVETSSSTSRSSSWRSSTSVRKSFSSSLIRASAPPAASANSLAAGHRSFRIFSRTSDRELATRTLPLCSLANVALATDIVCSSRLLLYGLLERGTVADSLHSPARGRTVRRQQLVADAANGLNQRSFGTGVDLFAQVVDVNVHDVRHRIAGQIPDMFDDLCARHALTGVAQQVSQQSEFLRSELDRPAATLDRAFNPAQFEILNTQHRFHRAVAAAQKGPDAGRQFREGKRLENQVVGAEVQHLHAIFGPGTAGQNQDRQLLLLGANRAQDIEAVGAREIQVQDGSVVVSLLGQAFRFFLIGREIDRILLRIEAPFKKPGECRIVLGDKNTHDRS